MPALLRWSSPSRQATGKVEVKDYAGLIQRAPWLAGLLFIFLALAGRHPADRRFHGQVLRLRRSGQQQMWVLAAVGAVNTVVAAFYYLNVVRFMFFAPAEEAGPVKVALSLRTALIVTAIITLVLGLAPGPLIAWATNSVQLLALK